MKTDVQLQDELLALAKSGAPRPSPDSELGKALRRFIPPLPDLAYAADWKGWDDFLGTGDKPGTIERSPEYSKKIAEFQEFVTTLQAQKESESKSDQPSAMDTLMWLAESYLVYLQGQLQRWAK